MQDLDSKKKYKNYILGFGFKHLFTFLFSFNKMIVGQKLIIEY